MKLLSHEDAQILYNKNIELLRKLYTIHPPSGLFNMLQSNVNSVIEHRKSRVKKLEARIAQYIKEGVIPISKSKHKEELQSIRTEIQIMKKEIDMGYLFIRLSGNMIKTLNNLAVFFK